MRGLARGAGSDDGVGSPSFTISREYKTPKFVMHHYDFYRLGEPGIMADELHEVMSDDQAVVVVEWADVAEHVLPSKRVIIRISATGDRSRDFVITLPHKYAYLKGGA